MRMPPLEIRELVVEARVTSQESQASGTYGPGAAQKLLAALTAGGAEQDRLVETIVQLALKRLRDQRET